ncbi:uncharacterized protein F5Z01DRAFT_623812 [Emericellopsis atlantica]|uniref:Uncharacterized protein n=1 Tax=Emericellopsis atlantica TaxID=2614577 RepID=A0A9P8CND8_9HYPO|nr:uncharacterized protein F5Z01DRAFT_623812 [Emericellopsis atlantica]KAG9253679.1 hypothetical protein F5Z01DRAFT_623812 [Emericellopsis atlantica]
MPSPISTKNFPQTTSQALPHDNAAVHSPPAHDESMQYHKGFFKTTPWIGLVGIMGTGLTVAAIVIVLLSADGKATDAWPTETTQIPLSVILAILIGVGNAALTMAYREGVTVAWWVRMIKGTSLYDSHRYWQHGSSAFEAIKGLRHLSKVTLVSITLLLLIVDGPLLQRAAGITTVTETAPATFKAAVSDAKISQPTAYYMTRARSVNSLSGNFSQVVMAYSNNEPISLDLQGCKGSCTGTLVAAGFDVSCKTKDTEYSLEDMQGGDRVTVGTISVKADGIGSPGILNISTAYKPSTDKKGNLVTTNCTLHSAQVEYPFQYANGTLTLEGTISSVDDIANRTTALTYYDPEAAGMTRFPSTLGGIAYAIDSIYASDVDLYNSGSLAIMGTGPMQYTYMNSSDDSLGTADVTWTDPTPAVLEAIRELTFRTALAFSDSSAEQSIDGSQLRTTTKYALHVEWMAGALAILVLGELAVFFLYSGFWLLGRPVSMSPLETATAFQAPLTAHADSNADGNELAKRLGDQSVRYEVVHRQNGHRRRAIVLAHKMR